MRWLQRERAAAPRRAARRTRRLVALSAGLLLTAACAGLELRGSLERNDLAWQQFALTFRHDAGLDPRLAPVAIVGYDDASQQEGVVFDRPTTARLVTLLHRTGVRLILLDRLYEDTRPGTAELAAALRQAGNVVLAQEVTVGSSTFTLGETVVPLNATLATAARTSGVVDVPADSDKEYRRYNLEISVNSTGRHLPSFALVAARANGTHPAVEQATFLINFAGPAGATFPHYSLAPVLDGRQNLDGLAGKIVLVGDETTAGKDYFATPVDGPQIMSGVELHAHALNTLLDGNPLRRVPPLGQVALTFPAALLGAAWALRHRLLSSLLVAVLLMGGVLGMALAAFLALGVWLDVAAPLLATIVAPLGVLGVRLGLEERAHRELRSLFGRYVAPGVVARIADDPDAFGLEGELRTITVLFSDIRSFTTLSEDLPPQRIVGMLSRYFTAMVEEIQAQGGTVDKYVGDAIMALFGAPDDLPDAPARAVRAALAMQRRLVALNADSQARGDPPLAAGIGLHHGTAAVGIIGAPSKREYSAIGDTVNTASRLETATKDVGYAIVASGTVVAALPADLYAEAAPHDLGAMAVKGRMGVVQAFGLGGAVHPQSGHQTEVQGL